MGSNPVYWARYDSPIGGLLVTSEGGALTGLSIRASMGALEKNASAGRRPLVESRRPFERLFPLLDRYFNGERVVFGLLAAPAGSAFDIAVWGALREIPWGSTASYGDIAARLGKAGAARAIGGACGRNPLPIIIPCHRVLRSGGGLGGFTGGLDIKRALLAMEGLAPR